MNLLTTWPDIFTDLIGLALSLWGLFYLPRTRAYFVLGGGWVLLFTWMLSTNWWDWDVYGQGRVFGCILGFVLGQFYGIIITTKLLPKEVGKLTRMSTRLLVKLPILFLLIGMYVGRNSDPRSMAVYFLGGVLCLFYVIWKKFENGQIFIVGLGVASALMFLGHLYPEKVVYAWKIALWVIGVSMVRLLSSGSNDEGRLNNVDLIEKDTGSSNE